MQLKNYQKTALAKLEKFLTRAQLLGAAQAFEEVAPGDDNPYGGHYTPLAGIADCPYVCLRLPTGGGKTLLAALSIAKVARYLQREFPVVLWMTPSEIICQQTVEALKSPCHPYRAAMDADFGGRVEVWDIGQWQQIRPQDMSERACIVVSTIQALRITDTDKRKVYAHNENLEPHFQRFAHDGLKLEKDNGRVKFSFANLLHIHRPVVIVDEAHNAVTKLSSELHERLRPSCIIEFTATPRDSRGRQMHNVLVNVPATALRDEEMIKLPIELTEHKTWQDAVNGAVTTRQRLAKIARDEKEQIRPVVLYQAQSRNNEVTVDALKKHLIENERIAEEKIAVATGEQRELDDIDINDPQCQIEHVITVQALKEGWDCPFAYVLCTVANVRSATNVEQLLGRVMRMPFAKQRNRRELNRAYAHVPETQFSHAAHTLRDKLVGKMGFEQDEADNAVQFPFSGWLEGTGEQTEPQPEQITVDTTPDFSGCTEKERKAAEQAVEVQQQDDGKATVVVKGEISPAIQEAIVEAVTKPDEQKGIRVRLRRKNLEFQISCSPARRGEKFSPLPQLFFIFDKRELEASPENIESVMKWNPLEQDYILSASEFSIKETAESFQIDYFHDAGTVEKLGIRETGQWKEPEFMGMPDPWDESKLMHWLEREIRTGYLTQEVLEKVAGENVKALLERKHTLENLLRFKHLLARALQEKLKKLRDEAKTRNYQQVLFGTPASVHKLNFEFRPDPSTYEYNFTYEGPYKFKKHYYGPVGDLKGSGEEYNCAIELDKMPEVRHWIRNVDRKPSSFWLPLSHNKFYPDFIAELTDGRLMAVEYKGAHLLAGAEEKNRIGKLWEDASDGKAIFAMPSQQEGGPSVGEQIREKLGQ